MQKRFGPDTPQWVDTHRMVAVSYLLQGRLDLLEGYPHPYIAVWVDRAGGGMGTMSQALLGAEILREHGWELVNVAHDDANVVHAVMRRTGGR